jgi:hypothetical protein
MHAPLPSPREVVDRAIQLSPELELYRDAFEQALGRKRYKRAYARFDKDGSIPRAVVEHCQEIISKHQLRS